MNINFDIISDLNLETIKNVDWEHKATSLFCVVAGNVSSNHDVVFDFLEHISNFYRGVFYVDGMLEHEGCGGDYRGSYDSLRDGIEEMEHVFFLHENIVVLDGVTLVGTNGWTSFNFTDESLIESNMELLAHNGTYTEEESRKIFKMAVTDQSYIHNSIATSYDIPDVDNLVIVTNCVPRHELIQNDPDYRDTILGDTVGSAGITRSLALDTKKKVSTWIFGRYPHAVDTEMDGIRYISNPASAKDFDIYYPKIVKF